MTVHTGSGFSILNYFPDICDSSGYGTNAYESGMDVLGNLICQASFSGTWWSPKYYGWQISQIQINSKRLAVSHEVFLTYEFFD